MVDGHRYPPHDSLTAIEGVGLYHADRVVPKTMSLARLRLKRLGVCSVRLLETLTEGRVEVGPSMLFVTSDLPHDDRLLSGV